MPLDRPTELQGLQTTQGTQAAQGPQGAQAAQGTQATQDGWRERALMGVPLELAGVLVATAILLALGAMTSTVAVALAAGVIVARALRPRRAQILPAVNPAGSARELVGQISAADVLKSALDASVVVDRRGVVLLANPAAHDLFTLLKRDRPLSFAIRSPDIADGIERALREMRPISVDYTDRTPPERVFRVTINAITGQAGDLAPVPGERVAAALFFRDVTAERRLERMRVDFVANASHELRTPLASLLGFVETLQGPAKEDAPARERFLVIMREQGQRMARLIDDLLSLSRIELDMHLPLTSAVAVDPLIGHIVDTLSPLARERQVVIENATSGSGPLMVMGDRDDLLRVFENLVENAIKYGQSGGRVEIAATLIDEAGAPHGAVAIGVRDHGPGIAPEHLPRLTERFYRADITDSRSRGGTGLGLAIVKHILIRHRGRLAIESAPGKGAQFTVILPLSAPMSPLARPKLRSFADVIEVSPR